MSDSYQKKRIRTLCILVILIIGVTVGDVAAQHESGTVILSIEASSDFSEYQTRLVTELTKALAEHDIELKLSENQLQSNINMGIFPAWDDELMRVEIRVNTPLEIENSPILYAQYNRDFWYPFEKTSEPRRDFVLQNLIGLSLYSINRCDLALNYFDATSQYFMEGVTYISFYMATCELVAGNYRKAADLYNNSWYMVSGGAIVTNHATINLAWILAQNQEWVLEDGRKWMLPLLSCKRLYESPCPTETRIDHLKHLAQVYALGFEYQKALETVDEAINWRAANSNYAELYVIRGEIHLLLYEWENARADFNQAIELDAEYAEAYFYRGVLHDTLIERENALADFEQYLVLAPDGRYAEQAARYVESTRTAIEASGD